MIAAWRGIRLLKERGLPLKLKSVAVTINQHEMQDMQRFAEEELGVAFKFDGMINARIDCSHSPLSVRLRPADMVRLDNEDPARRAQWEKLLPEPGAPAAPANDQMYSCGGGVSAYAIDPEGKLSICVLSQQDSYDLRAGNFKDGWDGFMRETRAKKVTRPSKCASCQLRALCPTAPPPPSSKTATQSRRWSTSARSPTCAPRRWDTNRRRTAIARSARAAKNMQSCWKAWRRSGATSRYSGAGRWRWWPSRRQPPAAAVAAAAARVGARLRRTRHEPGATARRAQAIRKADAV